MGQKKEPVKGLVREKQTDAEKEPGWVQRRALVRAADLVLSKARLKAHALVLERALARVQV